MQDRPAPGDFVSQRNRPQPLAEFPAVSFQILGLDGIDRGILAKRGGHAFGGFGVIAKTAVGQFAACDPRFLIREEGIAQRLDRYAIGILRWSRRATMLDVVEQRGVAWQGGILIGPEVVDLAHDLLAPLTAWSMQPEREFRLGGCFPLGLLSGFRRQRGGLRIEHWSSLSRNRVGLACPLASNRSGLLHIAPEKQKRE